MKLILSFLPFLISSLLGYLILHLLFQKSNKIDPLIHIFLSLGLGLGISSQITFLSYIFYNQLHPFFIISLHLILLVTTLQFSLIKAKENKVSIFQLKNISKIDLSIILILFICLIPMYLQAKFYRFGGWDAWSVWNLKARFLYLGGENWHNMFTPLLWRSSPHYPLLLPLINVWGWIFANETTYRIPMFTSLFYTFAVAGLLYAILKKLTKNYLSIIPVILMLSLPFFNKLSLSQYCDNIFSYYLLAGIFCIIFAKNKNDIKYALLAGIFIGFLTFTKNEGQIAAILILALALPYVLLKNKSGYRKKILYCLFITTFIAFIPTLLFSSFYATKNITFINGLVSQTNPSTLNRLKSIMDFYLKEIMSAKWNWIWLVFLFGLLFNLKKCFDIKIIIVPFFLLFYILIVTFYYYVNTQFEIMWWLEMTFNRILFAIIPIMLFWIFYSVLKNNSYS